jgi:hypothetical protein
LTVIQLAFVSVNPLVFPVSVTTAPGAAVKAMGAPGLPEDETFTSSV